MMQAVWIILTLICSSLLGTFVRDSCFVSDATYSAFGRPLSCSSNQTRSNCLIMHSFMLPVGAANGIYDVSLYLERCEDRFAAASRLALQRLYGAIPATVPIPHSACSTRYSEASCQRQEAKPRHTWLVVSENVLLEFGCVERHAVCRTSR
jgi:hypothetical protein